MSNEEKIKRLLKKVDEQAANEALWFRPRFLTEAELQQELKELHTLIEGLFMDGRMLILGMKEALDKKKGDL